MESLTGEKLFLIPEGYEYKPAAMNDEEFEQLLNNPALFLRMYANAKEFVEAWERGDDAPINNDYIEDSISNQL